MAILPFSHSARIALGIARAIAPANGHADVSALHVAIGVIRGYENPAVSALGFLGIPLDALRHDLQRALPAPGSFNIREPVLSSSPGEEAIVAEAVAVAKDWGDEHIGAQHLLAALLRDGEGVVARVCSGHGVSAEEFEEKVRSMIMRHHPPPSPPKEENVR